jgi:hypothetical protein
MSVQAILGPVFALVALMFILIFRMAMMRGRAVRSGEVTPGGGSPRTAGWPKRAQQASDAYHNQLELPAFFYLLVVLAMITDDADMLFVTLSWVFVVTRYVHAFVHVGANRLRNRFAWFAAGVFILLLMWLLYAYRILVA